MIRRAKRNAVDVGNYQRLIEQGILFLVQSTRYFMSTYSIGDALKQFLQKSRLKGSIQALQINDVWEQIMGKTIAKYTDKIQIHGHTL